MWWSVLFFLLLTTFVSYCWVTDTWQRMAMQQIKRTSCSFRKVFKNRWQVSLTHHHMTLSSATSRDLDMELGVHRRCVCNIKSRMTNISEFVFNCQHHQDHPSNELEKITEYMSCWVCEELWKSGLGALAFELMSVVAVQGRVRSGERVTFFRPTHSIHESNRILEISGIQ